MAKIFIAELASRITHRLIQKQRSVLLIFLHKCVFMSIKERIMKNALPFYITVVYLLFVFTIADAGNF
jgi:hypothetical protein